jgi:hypothetical protein
MRKIRAVICLIFLLMSCGPKTVRPETVALLAQQVHLSVGGKSIHLPLIAIYLDESMSRAKRQCLELPKEQNCNAALSELTAATQNNHTIVVNSVDIRVEDYSSFLLRGSPIIMPDLCPRLARQWPRDVCADKNVLGGRLYRFTLVHQDHTDGVGEDYADLLHTLDLAKAVPQRACPKGGTPQSLTPQNLCVAVVRLGDELLAVWIVARQGGMLKVERHATAIKAFVDFAISDIEDHDAFLAHLPKNP